MARSGYTLPVFAVAAAKAALLHLHNPFDDHPTVTLDLLPGSAEIEIQQVARLDPVSALAVTRSDPGDNLDLTRNTPIWAWVKLGERHAETLILEAGEGLGKTTAGDPAIYQYARRLFAANLEHLIPNGSAATVSIILPEGRQLAERTSNPAFGIVDGLSLLGTSGISQPLSAEDHLETFRLNLRETVKTQPHLVFCIGSNGMQVAQRLNIPAHAIVQTGNWIGALLVEAGLLGAQSVLLLGYQGKLIKLAGGIFNTSSHLADAKLEIIAAAVAKAGGSIQTIQTLLQSSTADAAYKLLLSENLAPEIFNALAEQISQKATNYVHKYTNVSLQVGTILFDRQGQIISQDRGASSQLSQILER